MAQSAQQTARGTRIPEATAQTTNRSKTSTPTQSAASLVNEPNVNVFEGDSSLSAQSKYASLTVENLMRNNPSLLGNSQVMSALSALQGLVSRQNREIGFANRRAMSEMPRYELPPRDVALDLIQHADSTCPLGWSHTTTNSSHSISGVVLPGVLSLDNTFTVCGFV